MPRETAPGYRITDINQEERPRERLKKNGASSLSAPELLAIIIGSGIPGENAIQIGQRLLIKYKSFSGIYKAGFDALCGESGIGPARAAQILAAMEIARRMTNEAGEQKPAIMSPDDAAALLRFEMSLLEQEEMWVLLMNTRNSLIEIDKLYRGSVNASQVRVGEVFKMAVRRNAVSILIVHNHPAGDPTPSPDDVVVTRAIVSAGQILDINVLDHIVFGRNQTYVSLKERGLGFS